MNDEKIALMSEQDRAVEFFVTAKKNFLLVFPHLSGLSLAHFAKESAKNTAGECMMRRFEFFKFGDLETTEGYWKRVIEHIDSIPSKV
jgi:hypothetical protein